MKRLLVITVLALVLAFSACTDEEVQENESARDEVAEEYTEDDAADEEEEEDEENASDEEDEEEEEIKASEDSEEKDPMIVEDANHEKKNKEDYRREKTESETEDVQDEEPAVNSAADTFGEVIYVSDRTFQKEVLDYDGFVLVDFYATWCGPCMSMAPSIEAIAKEHPEYKIVEVDVDQCYELSYNYNIESIPTLMCFKNGELMKKTVGYQEKSELLSMIEKYY